MSSLVHYSLGNNKTGKGVLIFNMKTGLTCSAEACRTCYLNGCYARNEDVRFSVIAQNDMNDYMLAKEHPDVYFNEVRRIIGDAYKKGFRRVRLHERGDFFSSPYLAEWISVSNEYPDLTFWAYTKQWDSVRGCLDILKNKPVKNFVLYASKWPGIDIPADIAAVLPVAYYGDVEESVPNKGTFVCPSASVNPKTGKHITCVDCGLCTKCGAKGINVCFKAHGTKALSVQKNKIRSGVVLRLDKKFWSGEMLKALAA